MTIAAYGRFTEAGIRRIAAERAAKLEAERMATLPKPVPVADPKPENTVVAETTNVIEFTYPIDPETAEAIQIMRGRSMPEWARRITIRVAKAHKVPIHAVIGMSRARDVCAARYEVFYLIKMHGTSPSYPRIAEWFCREHSGILYGAAKHALLNDLEPPSKWDIASKITKNRKLSLAWWHRRRAVR